MADGPRAVILAAGHGTRMKGARPKVAHLLGGRPLLLHVVAAAEAATGRRPIVVVNPDHPEVRDLLGDRAEIVDQHEPRGTGDALRRLPLALRDSGPVLVLSGDVPLIRPETLEKLIAGQARTGAAAVLLTLEGDHPGLGTVRRGTGGRVDAIVEERDLPPAAAPPTERNAGVYAFEGARLWTALDGLTTNNAQGEYYLTDVIAALAPDVDTQRAGDPEEALGINDRVQLAAAETVLRRRICERHMLAGVTIEDPATTYVGLDVEIGPDSVIRPMTTLRGHTALGRGCEIGPMAQLRDVRAGDEVRIGSSVVEEAQLGNGVTIGHFNRIRPNTVLETGVSLGTHAEVKNSTIGAGSRINHFACVLDSDVGRAVNIGAGTVTCNFDGTDKHRITFGDGVFVGSNSTLVAPVRIGRDAYIAAGSVVTADVPDGALAVGRGHQRNVPGWTARRRGRTEEGGS